MSRSEPHPTFPDVLRDEAARQRLPVRPRHHLEPLAGLPYARELALKEESLAAFLRGARLPLRPSQIQPSPISRGYRSTSKRRVLERGGRLVLAANRDDPAPGGFSPSALEPEGHAFLFRHLVAALNQPQLGRTASRLSWVILRAALEGTVVIFNAARCDERIVNGLTRLAREAVEAGLPLAGAYLFVDPTRSAYYLETGSTAGSAALQRLLGPERLTARFAGVDHAFHPGVFSQVNPSLVPAMLAEARRLLGEGGRLWDLYCGYGLIGLALADRFASIVGVEASAEAVACGRANAARLTAPQRSPAPARPRGRAAAPPKKPRPQAAIEFHEALITGPALAKLFGVPPVCPEAIVLDPPYSGAPAPVLLAAAARGAARVLHVFCNTSRIPADAAIWRKAGYRISELVPLDMFPGTPELETLVLFRPVGRPAGRGLAPSRGPAPAQPPAR